MPGFRRDPAAAIDPAINSPGREGLTGTAPASLYAPSFEREQITIAPDFAPSQAQPAWRQDFPIDWPQDLYVERRDFLKFMVLTSAAFTVGQLWIAAQKLRQTARVDEFQGEVRQAVLLADFVDLHDVRVLQAGDGFRFALEASALRRPSMPAGQDHLQRDLTLER